MQFRIGINVGDVMLKDGDVFGDGVNVAARLEGLVKGGEICVSRGVRDHLRQRRGIAFDDLGEQLVKNIAHPIRAFRLRLGEVESEPEPSAEGEPVEPPVEDAAPELPMPADEPSSDSEIALELAFWDSVKDAGPGELEAYLEKYPEGNFAALARARVEAAAHSSPQLEEAAPTEAVPDPLDLTFWNSVKDSDRREELEAYLEQHPDGHFAGLARARLSAPDLI